MEIDRQQKVVRSFTADSSSINGMRLLMEECGISVSVETNEEGFDLNRLTARGESRQFSEYFERRYASVPRVRSGNH